MGCKFKQMVSANKQQEGIKSVLSVVMRSGKVSLGYKSTLKSIRKAKAKLIFISNNCPAVWKTQLEYYAVLSGIKTILYDGNNVDLGSLAVDSTESVAYQLLTQVILISLTMSKIKKLNRDNVIIV